jgi:hypothetical protein
MAANFNNNIILRSSSAVITATDDFTMLRAGVLYDAYAVANGAGAGTCRISKAGSNITDAMSVNAATDTLTRATSVAAVNNTFAVGDTLRVTKSAAVSTDTFAYLASTGVSS